MKGLIKEKLETLLREKYSLEGLNYTIEEPKDRHLGDLATNVCFLLSKHLKKQPHLLAEEMAKELSNEDFQAEPLRGFINFRFSEGRIKEGFRELLSLASNYYFEDIGKGKRLQIEFVSANPTGPLHLGHGRGAVVGDALYRLLKAFGYDVVREYYINDAGYQVYLFGLSILYRVYELFGKEDQELKQKFEEEGYKGNYVKELAKDVKAFFGEEVLGWEREQAIEKLGEYGVKRMLEDIKETLAFMGVEFDLWVSEKSLHQRGLVEKVIKLLEEKGYTYTQEGALWFKSSSFGDDKDRVLVRSDGTPTYFAGDIAYHYYKYERRL
jgi:arginyl-tRNA synthetase